MISIKDRLAHAWNAFQDRDTVESDFYIHQNTGSFNSTVNPSRPTISSRVDRSLLNTVTTRVALDAASFNIEHARVDENNQYLETIDSPLNECLRVEANKDQTGRCLVQDIVMSMFDEGAVAVVPIETSIDPTLSGSYNIYQLRTGKIVDWYPDFVRVEVYNDRVGKKERILMPKNIVAIIENPLYSIMNEPNSTFKRLIRNLNLLDSVNEASSSGKLDLIIQLPFSVRSEARQIQAEDRVKGIQRQLTGNNKYGIAYVDSTEHITQLNRPIENGLLAQIQYLTTQFYNQIGFTENVFNGKASEQELRNYYDRAIEPIVTAIIEEMRRKFLTKTARTQGQTIMGFRDIFRLVPANEIAEIADVFSRNEILTPNELRQIVGRKPSDSPHANELQNRNMPTSTALSISRKKPLQNNSGGNNNG